MEKFIAEVPRLERSFARFVRLNQKTSHFCRMNWNPIYRGYFEATGRDFYGLKNDEHMQVVYIVEILSEHGLQGWMMGYPDGPFWIFPATATIIAACLTNVQNF